MSNTSNLYVTSFTVKIIKEAMSRIMKKEEWDLLCLIEDQWMRKEIFPAVTWLSNKSGLDQIKVVEILSSPLLQQSLEARGIPMYSDLDDSLKPKQLALINLLLNPSDRRTQAEKLRALDIKPATFYGWKRQKPFQEAMRMQGERLFGDSQAEVHAALMKQALSGDVPAIKYVNQLSGRYDPNRLNSQVNVQLVMMRMVETLQKHVRDQDVLQAIAADFQEIMAAQPKELH